MVRLNPKKIAAHNNLVTADILLYRNIFPLDWHSFATLRLAQFCHLWYAPASFRKHHLNTL